MPHRQTLTNISRLSSRSHVIRRTRKRIDAPPNHMNSDHRQPERDPLPKRLFSLGPTTTHAWLNIVVHLKTVVIGRPMWTLIVLIARRQTRDDVLQSFPRIGRLHLDKCASPDTTIVPSVPTRLIYGTDQVRKTRAPPLSRVRPWSPADCLPRRRIVSCTTPMMEKRRSKMRKTARSLPLLKSRLPMTTIRTF